MSRTTRLINLYVSSVALADEPETLKQIREAAKPLTVVVIPEDSAEFR